MAVNKVVLSGETLIDLTADTVTPETLLSGTTAHSPSGEAITGSYEPLDLSADTVTASALLKGYTAHDAAEQPITGTCTYDADTSDADAVSFNILSGKTAYVKGEKLTGSMWTYAGNDVSITQRDYRMTIGQGYHDGTGSVAIADAEKAKIVPENIRKDVSILGITGTLTGDDTSDATASASDIQSGKTAYVNGDKLTGTCTYDADTSDATATASNIDSGKTAYVDGSKITGTSTKVDTSTATAAASDILSGKTAYVKGSKVTGTCPYDSNTSSATAAAADILSGKTAYVKGSKLTGTYTAPTLTDDDIALYIQNGTTMTKIAEAARGAVRIRNYAFYYAPNLSTADFPSVTLIGSYAFYRTSLKTVNFPLLEQTYTYAFYYCQSLTTVCFPQLKIVGSYSLGCCSALESADLPLAETLSNYAFYKCSALTSLLLRKTDAICTASAASWCNYECPLHYNYTGALSGYIYVPSALIDTYKTATNWSSYAAKFRALEDYTVDGTTTGALDSTKI